MTHEAYLRLRHPSHSWKRVVSVVGAILGFALVALVPGSAQRARIDSIPQNAFDILKSDTQATKKPSSLTKRNRGEQDMQQTGEQIAWEEVRNLFVPQRSNIEVRRQQEAAATIDSSTQFPAITGIITTKDGENQAILDGANVKVGERLKNFIVTKITHERVTIEGDETYILELRAHQVPAVKIFLVPDPGSGEDEIPLTPVSGSSSEPISLDPATQQSEGKGKKPHASKP